MAILKGVLESIGEFASVTGSAGGGARALAGLCAAAKAHVASAIAAKEGRTALVIVPDETTAADMAEDMSFFCGGGCEIFPYRDINFFEAQATSRDTEAQRLRVMGMLRRREINAVIATPDAAMSFLVPPDVFDAGGFALYEGREYNLDALCAALASAGYTRTDRVEGAGQFSRRGDLLDFFVPGFEDPVRVEFWGDEIDSISRFDRDSQRRGDRLGSVLVTPAREMPCDEALGKTVSELAAGLTADSPLKYRITEDAGRILDGMSLPWAEKYLTLRYGEHRITEYADFSVFICEYHAVKKRAETFSDRLSEDMKLLAERGMLIPGVRYCQDPEEFMAKTEENAFLLDEFPRTSYPVKLSAYAEIPVLPIGLWKGGVGDLADRISGVKESGSAVILAGTAKAAKNLAGDLTAAGLTAVSGKLPDTPAEKTVYVTAGRLSCGMEYTSAKVTVISFQRPDEKPRRRRGAASGEKISSLTDVSPGDAVVHAVHGVGIYEGIGKMEVQGVVKDYLRIRYSGGDMLYVPVTQMDMVGRYIGNEETVKLSKMGGTDWNRTKARVRSAVKDMAKELIDLYSRRMSKKGYAFSPDGEWQHDFEAHFEYTETEDQLSAAADIKKDMERPVPMDRLLCGDVGFGKTEVALRAAFKCVADGKQCAILVPTTLLAWQHYQSIMHRMEGFPVKVGLLCRFRSKKQQEDTLRDLAAGRLDIAVGTHRLVQKDVRFHDLGLMIIDEEQRFGVAQKEFLKNRYDTVDCLSLSATPIPRTLNMALSGIRDMSCIEEAPAGRQPVQTYVAEYDDGVAAEMIRRELRRGGQVYYLHNNTETIDRAANRIQKLVPEASVAVAHGKMSEAELNRVWEDLLDRKIDVLVCTTIIETGVDVPNVNTLIIENADRMGLSQLHQIRGRVGRSYRTAYAYFTFARGKAVSDIAAKRLDAIREYTEFGSGFKVAMRDLEIRGAGNVLGGEQHGHMDSVGYDMYVKLLSEAVSEEMGKPAAEEKECTVDIPVTAHIPESYISQSQRIEAYRRIAAVRTEEDAADVTDELIDRYGEPPKAVSALIRVALCRSRAKTLGITDIVEKNGMLLFYPSVPSAELVSGLASRFGSSLRVNAGAKPYYGIKYKGDILSAAENFLAVAEEITAGAANREEAR